MELENELSSLMESDGKEFGVGTEIILSVKDDKMYFSNTRNSDNKITFTEEKKIQNKDFCLALCDVYYGIDPVSVEHKKSVIDGIMSLITEPNNQHGSVQNQA